MIGRIKTMVNELIKKRGRGRPAKVQPTGETWQTKPADATRVKKTWPQPGDKIVVTKKEHPQYRASGTVTNSDGLHVTVQFPVNYGKPLIISLNINDIGKWKV